MNTFTFEFLGPAACLFLGRKENFLRGATISSKSYKIDNCGEYFLLGDLTRALRITRRLGVVVMENFKYGLCLRRRATTCTAHHAILDSQRHPTSSPKLPHQLHRELSENSVIAGGKTKTKHSNYLVWNQHDLTAETHKCQPLQAFGWCRQRYPFVANVC